MGIKIIVEGELTEEEMKMLRVVVDKEKGVIEGWGPHRRDPEKAVIIAANRENS